jgi:hypothetical protein
MNQGMIGYKMYLYTMIPIHEPISSHGPLKMRIKLGAP